MSKKRSGWIGIVAAVVCILVPIAVGEAIGKNGYLGLDIAKLLFSVLIQVNATIIGFWGIVFVYSLKSLDEHRRYFHTCAVRELAKIEKLALRRDPLSESEKKFLKLCSENVDGFSAELKNVTQARRDFAWFGIAITAAFLLSILVCVLALGLMGEAGIAAIWVTFSLMPLLVGVAFTTFGVWAVSPKAPRKLQKPLILTND